MGRRIFGAALWILGVLLVLFGAIWTLQGLGILMWPTESFMLADRQWAVNGVITAVAGIVSILVAQRIRRR